MAGRGAEGVHSHSHSHIVIVTVTHCILRSSLAIKPAPPLICIIVLDYLTLLSCPICQRIRGGPPICLASKKMHILHKGLDSQDIDGRGALQASTGEGGFLVLKEREGWCIT